jgi:thymidylate synthase ThyX
MRCRGKKGFQFIIPPDAMKDIPTQNWFADSALDAYQQYLLALEYGLKPEDARGLLPNCTKTEVVVTGTLDNWGHCIHHRGYNKAAQWQIKQLFLDAEKIIVDKLGWSPYDGSPKNNDKSKVQ